MDIVLKDNINKLFQEMRFLKEETELLISDNINTINRKGTREFQIETHYIGIDEYWKQQGYEIDNELYDKIILEYNQQNEIPLTRWK